MPGYSFMLTRNGIERDLIKSPYTFTTNSITYFFSSKMYLEKFMAECDINRDSMYYNLYRRFNCKVKITELYDLVLYSKIEKRGFLVKHKGVYFDCLNNIILDGVQRISKN